MGNGVLPVRGARRLVENALLDTVGLALLKRRPAVADLTALAAVSTLGASATNGVDDGTIVYVTNPGVCYRWRPYSIAAAATGVVVPDDRVTGSKPGRWIVTSSTIKAPDGTAISAAAYATPDGAYGAIRSVSLYQGNWTDQDWDLRVQARRPAVVIQWAGESGEQVSNLRGAIKLRWLHFLVYGVSFNARAGTEAALGSPIATEAQRDPGVSAIMDDLEDLLDGLTGAKVGVDGIDYMRLGDVSIHTENATQDLKQRLFMWSAPLDVRCTVGKEDRPTRTTLDELTATGVDPNDGETPLTPTYQVIP